MKGEAVFDFRCGTKSQAAKVADWLVCEEDWPEELRRPIEERFGDQSHLASVVFDANAIGRNVRVQATGPSALRMMVMILDYAMQKWRSVPSPQGFTYGRVVEPKIDEETYEMLDLGEYDGGAVLLCRGREPEVLSCSEWLEEALRAAKRR